MRKILALVRLNLTHIRHDRGAIFSMVLLPVVLTSLLGVLFGGTAGSDTKVPIAFVDHDNTVYSRRVETLLERAKGFEVATVSESEATKRVADNKVAAVVIVPQGFGTAAEDTMREAVVRGGYASPATARIEIIKGSDPTRVIAIEQVIGGIVDRLNADREAAWATYNTLVAAREKLLATPLRLVFPASNRGAMGPYALALSPQVLATPIGKLPTPVRSAVASVFPGLREIPSIAALNAAADKQWDPAPVSVKLTAVKASSQRGQSTIATGYNQYSLGMTIWFVLMLVLGNAESLLEERENGTLPRLLTTPTPRAQVLGGKVGGVYVVGIVQAAILITFGALVFHVEWGSDPVATGLLIGTFTLAATGLAIMVSAVARTRSQAAGLTPVLAVSLSMLGGCVWPIEIVPPFMKVIALFTPTGWAMKGLTDVVVRNQGIQAAVLPTMMLLIFAAVFFVVGLTRFRWE